ncbi:MAG: hypothetical protein M1828_005483 [Chrysothrix sp. TS-e1954]|nr:MAG: hypothetical protein M1828_005483 [Chrysothrix sp. TS-e1954]
MQSRNIICRPSVCRIAKSGIPTANRNVSMFAPTPYYPRYPSGSDFAPLFRLLDDFTSPRSFDAIASPVFHRGANVAQQQRYQPRFDIKEAENAYELRGELPGVEPADVEVAFTDEQTLVIKGRIERESSSGAQPQAVTATSEQSAAENTEAFRDTDDAASDFSSSSYQKPTVEDEDAATTTQGQPTPAESTAEGESSKAPVARHEAKGLAKPESQYWISERSTGEFQRTFNFPARVNQDGVTASLRNGILNLTIPKAAAPTSRRIAIQ